MYDVTCEYCGVIFWNERLLFQYKMKKLMINDETSRGKDTSQDY